MLTAFRERVLLGPKESNFKLEWTPRVLRPGAQLSVDFSINLRKHLLNRCFILYGGNFIDNYKCSLITKCPRTIGVAICSSKSPRVRDVG